MRRFILFLMMLIFWSHGARATFTETSLRFVQAQGNSHTYDVTLLSMSPASTVRSDCKTSLNPCSVWIGIELMDSKGGIFGRAPQNGQGPYLLRGNDAHGCNTPTCKVSTNTANTLGELAPLFYLRGDFGKTVRMSMYVSPLVVGLRTCVVQTTYYYSSGSVLANSSWRDCGPTIPLITTCDILDNTATVDFGSFSNDIKNVKASGSFRVNCSSEAFLRVKFASSVSNIPLSQDGNLNATLKVRDGIKGATDLESFIKVPFGGKEIIIDGELNNNNTSHTGPFSASVVAIVEIA